MTSARGGSGARCYRRDEFKAALAEGNLIYRNANSSDSQKIEAARRLRALLGQVDLTGISTLNGTDVQVRDGKYIKDGRIMIVRNGKTYNAVGVAY